MAPTTRSQGGTPAIVSVQPEEELDSGLEDDEVQSESSIQDFLQPLHETAERVSQQVEEFASRLHRFKADRAADNEALWQDAWALLDEYHALAKKRLADTGSRASRAFSHRKSLGDNSAQTQKVQLEADLWILTKNLLLSNSPRAKADAADAQADRLGELNRYSANPDIWNAFLDSDTIAQEYETTLSWLHERAEQTSPPVDALIQNLTTDSARGEGFWSAGPMFTKNAIKKQKRDRAWPLPLDPSNPGLSSSLRRQSDGQRIVSQLDPDAPTREKAYLEVQDDSHERAAWITCWELLRRGSPISDIRAWWDERNEQWRSLLLRGCDSRAGEAVQSPWFRMMNLATNSEWASRCKMLAETTAEIDPYQRSVYAVLCGESAIADKTCVTIDDHLFSKFNALLIHRYQGYLLAYQKKLADSSQRKYHPSSFATVDIRQFIKTSQATPDLKDEAQEPHKLIQMALMGKDFDSFFVQIGRAAAQIAYIDEGFGLDKLIARDDTANVSEAEQLTATDEDSVRVVTHLQLVLQALGLLQNSWEQNQYQLENNIVNYMCWLQKDQKWSLLPIYASKLSRERTQHTLGQILIQVTNEKDREGQVRLLKKYGINVSEVVYGIASLGTYYAMRDYTTKFRFKAPRITERVGPGNSGQTRIRTAFMGADPEPAEDKLIRSVEWYRFVDADKWGWACHHISFLYKYFLCEGKLGALRDLVRRVNLGATSLSAFSMNLAYADESQDEENDGEVQMNGTDDEATQKISPRKRKQLQDQHLLARPGTSRAQMYEKSRNWLQLQQLVVALDALERWQDFADEMEENRHEKARLRTMKRELEDAFDEAMASMEPILDPEFLTKPNDSREAEVLREIRNHYLPECILAYNSVLFFAGHALSRTWLVDCMKLAQTVSQTPNLTTAFVESGRMRELVNAFAVDSQALLLANEQGKKGGKKERGIEMWQVSWRHDELDLEALD